MLPPGLNGVGVSGVGAGVGVTVTLGVLVTDGVWVMVIVGVGGMAVSLTVLLGTSDIVGGLGRVMETIDGLVTVSATEPPNVGLVTDTVIGDGVTEADGVSPAAAR